MSEVDTLKVLTDLVEQADALNNNVIAREKDLKAAKAKHTNIIEKEIPEVMSNIGIASFKTESGLEVDLTEKVRASLTVANRPMGHAWIRERGEGSIIEHIMTVPFGAGEDERAEDFRTNVLKAGEYPFEEKESVHHSRLNSYITGLLEDGVHVPEDIFSVYIQPLVKIKRTN